MGCGEDLCPNDTLCSVLHVQLRLGKNELLATCAHPVAEDIFVSRCKQQIESTSHSAVEFLIHLLN